MINLLFFYVAQKTTLLLFYNAAIDLQRPY